MNLEWVSGAAPTAAQETHTHVASSYEVNEHHSEIKGLLFAPEIFPHDLAQVSVILFPSL